MAAGVAWLLGQTLKKAFRRPRPYDASLAGSRLLIATTRPVHASAYRACRASAVPIAARCGSLWGSDHRAPPAPTISSFQAENAPGLSDLHDS